MSTNAQPEVYAVTIEIQDGENEYTKTEYVIGSSEASIKRAIAMLMADYGKPDDEGVYWSSGGLTAATVTGWQPVASVSHFAFNGDTGRANYVRFTPRIE